MAGSEGDEKDFAYVLVNRGGTLIEWGAAPLTAVQGEADFATKLQWLKECTSQYAELEWPQWPERINIRRGIVVTPRTAKKCRKARRSRSSRKSEISPRWNRW